MKCFSPTENSPTGQIADVEVVAEYEDLEAVREFASSVDVVTFEFENIPARTIEEASRTTEVHPKGEILYIVQNRLREKTFLFSNDFPVAPFYKVSTLDDLRSAVKKTGFPCVLKTAGFGYDGKGQSKINSEEDLESAIKRLEGHDCVLESFVEFEKEVSVVCARGKDGEFVHFDVFENDHADHILDITSAPADISHAVWEEVIEITRGIAEKFGYVGTMCVEFFVGPKDRVLVNEIAPRPHNSGHLTFDWACTSQFEQQLRAVLGLPLGDPKLTRPAAMANLLGDEWENGEPNWDSALQNGAKIHVYGKEEPRAKRKMGHLTASGKTAEEARNTVLTARKALQLITKDRGAGNE